MTPFWFGVVVFLCTSLISLVYHLLTLDGLVDRVRSFWFWLPANISFAFFSGIVWNLMHDNENRLAVGLVSAMIIGLNVVLALILDQRLSVVGKAWREDDVAQMRRRAFGIFLLGTVATATLYSLYAESNNAAAFWGIATIVAFLFLPVWNSFRSLELREAKYSIDTLLNFYCERNVIEIRDGGGETFWSSASPRELAAALEGVERSLEHVQFFEPVRRGKVLPGLKYIQISRHDIRTIADDSRKQYLNQLTERRHRLRLLLGSDAIADDSADALQKYCSPPDIEALRDRRRGIVQEKSWKFCSID
jgi:hypothetical protein